MAPRIVPPSASALIESLRGVGYSLEAAIADLVDNSIAAGARTIDIDWQWNDGQPTAHILDDGCGMSEETLVEAMRFGGFGPETPRKENDLGRFGLGLKTASLSQCRSLLVTSKTFTGISTFAWDIDHIKNSGGDWFLLDGRDIDDADLAARLAQNATGTIVAWRTIDFGRHEDRLDHGGFMRALEAIENHLAMVFHRFLAGDARRVIMNLNGRKISAWDPFLESNAATVPSPEQRLNGPGGRIIVRGFVLPHRDRFQNDGDFEKAGGPEGWTAQQGFYVYRLKRLLSYGGWLGLGGSRTWTREESSRLARIRIDIPNTADHDWRIDIRKAIARPPDALRKPLQRLAEDIRRKAREVFVHRGQYGPRSQAADVSRIWEVNGASGRRRYAIRRDHELVMLVKDRLSAQRHELLDALLEHIERTVPLDRVWLDVTESGVPTNENNDELVHSALAIAQMMERAGLSFADAAARVCRMDPYDQVSNLHTILLENRGKKR